MRFLTFFCKGRFDLLGLKLVKSGRKDDCQKGVGDLKYKKELLYAYISFFNKVPK